MRALKELENFTNGIWDDIWNYHKFDIVRHDFNIQKHCYRLCLHIYENFPETFYEMRLMLEIGIIKFEFGEILKLFKVHTKYSQKDLK